MNQDKLNEHMAKEAMKHIVDNSPNYTNQMKQDLKSIIDAGRSPEEICKAMLTYFASLRFF